MRTFFILLVIVIAGILGYAATKPDDFHYERSITIHAPAEKVFAQINDFKAWPAWSPFEKLDPDMKKSFGATTAGKGAHYEWEGNSKAGKGSIDIVESTPPSHIEMSLMMLKPFEARNQVVFTLNEHEGNTDVTWAMNGKQPFMGKVMSVFINCEKIVGSQFEEGLTNLKAVSENH